MPKPTTIRQFFKKFPDDDACLKHLFDVRFGQGHTCPKCKREAKWYPIQAERAYSCQWCGHHIHPTVGTLFEKSSTPLQLWFYVMFKFTQTRHGVSAKEVQRETGVTYKTAWRMCRMIREHMAEIDGEDPLGGEGTHVEIDETMVGGVRKGKRGRGAEGKTVVFGMLQRDGEVMVKVVPNVKRSTLQPLITANVKPERNVHSDELASYDGLEHKGYYPKRVNHSAGEYVGFDGATVNAIENFWRHLTVSAAPTFGFRLNTSKLMPRSLNIASIVAIAPRRCFRSFFRLSRSRTLKGLVQSFKITRRIPPMFFDEPGQITRLTGLLQCGLLLVAQLRFSMGTTDESPPFSWC